MWLVLAVVFTMAASSGHAQSVDSRIGAVLGELVLNSKCTIFGLDVEASMIKVSTAAPHVFF